MVVDITRVLGNLDSIKEFSFSKTFNKDELVNTELLELKDVDVAGFVKRDNNDIYTIKLDITGIMTLPCAITLEPVDYKFHLSKEENLEDCLKEINEKNIKLENLLDIFPIVWENILMEIPMRVVSENASLKEQKGEGWRLLSDDEELSINNNAFQNLKDLLEKEV